MFFVSSSGIGQAMIIKFGLEKLKNGEVNYSMKCQSLFDDDVMLFFNSFWKYRYLEE